MPRSRTLYNVNPPLVPPHHSHNKPVTINHHSVFEMERRSGFCCVFLPLFVLCLLSAVVTIEAGGWAPIKDVEDPHVREVAQYAVSEHGRLKHLQLKLDKVVEGETQKDTGITYRLVLTVEEKGTDTKDYTVVVVEENAKLHLKSFKKVVIKSKSSHRAM
ncbi:hypothetical protein Tsubulata_024498 [Turnera subulata]|uniref:Cystatin domain-containing protein n=1 Tax=Turnera subulata TaxID=218843 RepID=A0A9Q0GJD0_9ROSI|nr:hypothetical protein Tsubulata_024498 [Turnera subulata]